MKTKQIPVMIALAAGFITCLLGYVMHMETNEFVKALVIVLISFYLLGSIAKFVLDKNFREETEEATDEAVEEADSQEEEAAEESTEEEN